MKILFWLNGSGGQRRERKVVDFPTVVTLNENHDEIYDSLDEWKDSLNCNSEYIRWGWDENFDSVKLEPLSPRA